MILINRIGFQHLIAETAAGIAVNMAIRAFHVTQVTWVVIGFLIFSLVLLVTMIARMIPVIRA